MWSLELTNRDGVAIGEIDNASNREFTFALNQPNTIKFDVSTQHQLAPALMSAKHLVKLYKGSTLKFYGPVIGLSRVRLNDTKTISVAAADPSWYFAKTFPINQPYAHPTLPPNFFVAGSLMDSGIQNVGEITIDTMITSRTREDLVRISDTLYQQFPDFTIPTAYTIADEDLTSNLFVLMNKLSGAWTTYEWQILPTEPINNFFPQVYGPKVSIGDLDIRATIGQVRGTNVSFEYGPGTAANISTATDIVDVSTMANMVMDYNADAPQPYVYSIDYASIQTYGLMQDVITSGIYDADLRQQLTDEHVRLRSHPKRTVTFQPKDYPPNAPGSVPVFGTDWDVGDFVRGSAADEDGVWFNGTFRVYGWTAKPDELGAESGELTLIDDAGGTV